MTRHADDPFGNLKERFPKTVRNDNFFFILRPFSGEQLLAKASQECLTHCFRFHLFEQKVSGGSEAEWARARVIQ